MPSSSVSRTSARLTLAAIALVLLIASFVGTPLPGTNEPHYLSKARATVDPDWCQEDFFLQSANAHAVFFSVVGPLTKWLPFQIVLTVGRIVSLLIVATGFRALCRALACEGPRAVIAASLFFLIGLTGNFSGEWVIGGFESKVPAYGFAFLSIAFCIDGRLAPSMRKYVAAGGFVGLAIALHPVVGMWTLIAISMTEVWLWIRPTKGSESSLRGISSLLRRGTTFIVTGLLIALPGLLPAFQMLLSSTVASETKLEAKQIQVFYRLAHHLDPTRFSAYSWWHTTALTGLCGIAAFLIHRRSPPVYQSKQSSDENSNSRLTGFTETTLRRKYLLTVLLCSAIIALTGIAIGWHDDSILKIPGRHWRAALLQFYPFRLFDALLPLTTAILLASIPLRNPSSLMPSEEHDADPAMALASPSIRPLIGVAAVLSLTCAACAFLVRPESPSGYSPALFAEWKTACEWLKQNSPPDAVIFAPRESFGLKLFADRAEYVCFKDCPQDAEGIVEWNRRLWTLHNWSKKSYEDKLFSRKEVAALNSRTGIQYILTRRLGPFETLPVWEGEAWSIYAIDEPPG